jgi:hypothetical protein
MVILSREALAFAGDGPASSVEIGHGRVRGPTIGLAHVGTAFASS